MCNITKNKLGKRHRFKKAIKASVRQTKKLPGRIIKFSKSQISERLRPDRIFQFVFFGLLFQSTPSLAFDINLCAWKDSR